MAISRMNMERQLRNMGGLMTLEEPRQGYFLGKIVRKAKRAIKKVVKSPLGKAAIIGGLGMYAGGLGPFANLKGAGFLRGAGGGLGSILSKVKSGEGMLGQLGNVFRVGGEKDNPFSLFRLAGGLAGAGALAAPFLMGGGEEEGVDEGVPVSGVQPMVADIREQARQYYQDPTKSALYFMPPESAVQKRFFAEGGGLADIPRGGYNEGKSVLSKEQMTMIKQMKDKGSDIDTISSITGVSLEDVNKFLASLNQKAEGGIMDLGGMEKDYREGGFVPIGAEERADDVPARLSKNEFVFTADAVRNAGGGDIDKGAEVMQNMMDNLEAGGMISEESQGKENPAQAMFDQAQMLENRIV